MADQKIQTRYYCARIDIFGKTIFVEFKDPASDGLIFSRQLEKYSQKLHLWLKKCQEPTT